MHKYMSDGNSMILKVLNYAIVFLYWIESVKMLGIVNVE